MAIPITQIVGLLLVIVGVVLIILKLSGKLTAEDAGGEITSKLFTLKGGTGLVIISLGIIVLMGGYLLEKPQETSNSDSGTVITEQIFSPSPAVENTLSSAPAPEITFTPLSTPVQTLTPVPDLITASYLVGTWSSSQDSITETIFFYSDGSFYLEDYYIYTTQSVYISGTYYVSGSTLFLETSGVTTPYSIIYVDRNSFRVGTNLYYYRVA